MPVRPGSAPARAGAPISAGSGMTTGSEWTGRVGTAWADEWRRTDRSFGALTDRLVEVAGAGNFDFALDVGCGAGEVSCRLAAANPEARIRGVDISAELLCVARERGADQPNLIFEEADAAAWRAPPAERPDLLVSRHGVMFFAEPVAAFANLRAQAAPGARIVFSCFRRAGENEWAAALTEIVPQPSAPADPGAPGPFAFGDPARVERILGGAGWKELVFEPFDYAMVVGEGADAVEDALGYFQRIGPAARGLAGLPDAERAVACKRLRALLASRRTADAVAMPSAAWIVSASRG